jgi:hypothetical protein
MRQCLNASARINPYKQQMKNNHFNIPWPEESHHKLLMGQSMWLLNFKTEKEKV